MGTDPFRLGAYDPAPQRYPLPALQLDQAPLAFADLWVAERPGPEGMDTAARANNVVDHFRTMPQWRRRDSRSLEAYAMVDWHRRRGEPPPIWVSRAAGYALGLGAVLGRAGAAERLVGRDVVDMHAGRPLRRLRAASTSTVDHWRGAPGVRQRRASRLRQWPLLLADDPPLHDMAFVRGLVPSGADRWFDDPDGTAAAMIAAAEAGEALPTLQVRRDVHALVERTLLQQIVPSPTIMHALAAALGLVGSQAALGGVVERDRFMEAVAAAAASGYRPGGRKLDAAGLGPDVSDRVVKWQSMPMFRRAALQIVTASGSTS